MVELLHDGDFFLDEIQAAEVFVLLGAVPVEGGVEAEAGGEGALAAAAGGGAPQEVRLGAFAEAGFGEFFDGLDDACVSVGVHVCGCMQDVG